MSHIYIVKPGLDVQAVHFVDFIYLLHQVMRIAAVGDSGLLVYYI